MITEDWVGIHARTEKKNNIWRLIKLGLLEQAMISAAEVFSSFDIQVESVSNIEPCHYIIHLATFDGEQFRYYWRRGGSGARLIPIRISHNNKSKQAWRMT